MVDSQIHSLATFPTYMYVNWQTLHAKCGNNFFSNAKIENLGRDRTPILSNLAHCHPG